MAAEIRFTIGAEVNGTDGVCGRLAWVVVDRSAAPWVITHLVVEPPHRAGLGRFVPLDRVASVDETSGAVALDCTMEQFEQLGSAEETEFVPPSGAYSDYGPAQLIARPYYTDEPSVRGGLPATSQVVTADAPLPGDGEAAVHRARAHASDGVIGEVAGLVVDPASQQVTHVLLKEGHVWGRKEVAIPIGAVKEAAEDGIHLSISTQEIGDLPPVNISHRDR